MAKMKAVVKTKPELGAEYVERDLPELKPDWVLVKVRATSICGTDVHIYSWDRWSRERIGERSLPQTLGHEVAGIVVEVGEHCKRVKVGDYVSAETHIYDPSDLQTLLGSPHVGTNMKILGVDCDGAFAEYFAIPESVCWQNDPTIPPEFATVQEPLGNAVHAVLGYDHDVAGKSMLIVGDGPISLYGVGVARACGVTKIIQFGMSEFNMAIGKRMGADVQIFVNRTTPSERLEAVLDHTNGNGVDIAVEMAGNQSSVSDCFACVRKAGRVSTFGVASEAELSIDYNNAMVFKACQVHGISGRQIFDTWYRTRNLISSGRLDVRPVMTHMFALEDFKAGFDLLLDLPRCAAKVVLFPERSELEAAQLRMNSA